jgi:hypothetical protein
VNNRALMRLNFCPSLPQVYGLRSVGFQMRLPYPLQLSFYEMNLEERKPCHAQNAWSVGIRDVNNHFVKSAN